MPVWSEDSVDFSPSSGYYNLPNLTSESSSTHQAGTHGSPKPQRHLCRKCGLKTIVRWLSFSIFLLTSSLLALVHFAARSDECSMRPQYLGGIWPRSGGVEEWLWTLLHRLGTRNLLSVLRAAAPPYRAVLFAAASAGDGQHRISLTIDDAIARRWPMNLSHVEDLFNVLDDQRVTATLFVIANEATLSQEGRRLLKRAASSGHEIGNHGMQDDRMDTMSENEFASAINAWEQQITSVLGQWPSKPVLRKWFRPPKGLMSSAMARVLKERGYAVSLPDIWSDDSGFIDADFQARVLVNAPCDGSVLLMHVPDSAWGTQILDVLPTALPALRKQGFEFVGLTQLHATSAPDTSTWRFLTSMAITMNVFLLIILGLTLGIACPPFCIRSLRRARLRTTEEAGLELSILDTKQV